MKDMERAASDLLQEARDGIDKIDADLVRLLQKRKSLVQEVAKIKSAHGLPVYLPVRENDLIRARRKEAKAVGLSPDLLEDILRRIMRESYKAEAGQFKSTMEHPAPVVLVGGGGEMGRLFSKLFTQSGYEVRVLEAGDWDRASDLLNGAGLVLMAVPISATLDVLQQLKGLLPETCVLADMTSTKAEPLAKMMEVHDGPVLGLHPMFGPDTRVLAKQVVVWCRGRRHEACQWLLDQFQIWGATLLEAEPDQHDRMMAIIQAMRHFETFVYGVHLQEEDVDLGRILEFSSPIYRLELGMIGRLFAQDPRLYADIIFSSKEGKAIVHRYLGRFSRLEKLLKANDRDGFIRHFKSAAQWFGQFAEHFLEESNHMIEKADERRHRKP